MRCQVSCCKYLAESEITIPGRASFRVCPLHDAPQVVAILANEEQPHHYRSAGRPIVIPCGPLAPQERDGGERCFDDPWLSEIDDTPTVEVWAGYDLTRTDWGPE